MKKTFNKKFKLFMKSIKPDKKHLVKEDIDDDVDDEELEYQDIIDNALKLIKVDVSPAIAKLKELGFIDGPRAQELQEYIDDTFNFSDIDDVLMTYKLALIRQELGLTIHDKAAEYF